MRKISIFMVLLAAATPAMADNNGKAAFMQSCSACHSDPAKPDVQPRIGPSLKGVVGRRAATAPGFSRYSPAMKRSGQTWNRATLNAYLAAPARVVPGTTMTLPGVPDAARRTAIINYLTTGK